MKIKVVVDVECENFIRGQILISCCYQQCLMFSAQSRATFDILQSESGSEAAIYLG